MAYTRELFVPIFQKYGTSQGFTYKEVGIHFATLNAAVNRGIMRKEGSKYFLTDKGIAFITIEHMHNRKINLVSLRLKGHDLGMLCEMNGMDVLDKDDKPFEYDLDTEIWSFPLKKWIHITWEATEI